MRPDPHRPLREFVQEYENVAVGRAFGLTPRSTHDISHPRTHSIVVMPSGASMSSSNAGPSVCARATAQPNPTSAHAIAILIRFLRMPHLTRSKDESNAVIVSNPHRSA